MKTYSSDQFTDNGFYLFRQSYRGQEASHKHNFTELVYIADGVCHQTVDGVCYRAASGDVILIEEGMTHAFGADDREFTYVNLILTHDFLQKYADDPAFCQPTDRKKMHAVSLTARASLPA